MNCDLEERGHKKVTMIQFFSDVHVFVLQFGQQKIQKAKKRELIQNEEEDDESEDDDEGEVISK